MASSGQVAAFRSLLAAGAHPLEAAEVIELARTVDQIEIDLSSQAWKHELRGKHGEWSKTGGASPAQRGTVTAATSGAAKRARARKRAAIQAQAKAAEEAAKPVPFHKRAATMGQLAVAQQQTQNIATEAAAQAAQHALNQAKDIHENYVQEHTKAVNETEKKKSWKKFFAMTSSLVVGGVGGYIESKYGVPNAAVMATSITPAIGEALFEAKNRL